jgi:hypothetical protein
MWINRVIWKYFVRRIARAHGFLDPMSVLSRLSRFAQPAEVMAPSELLRAAAIMHARGLINSQAIQHNLDWVWPYWVECQFNPHNIAFVPRAFSLTHINLTHRNWTAVGLPDSSVTPIVDPRGLLTPFWDSWSVDAWIMADDGRELIPSQQPHAEQSLDTHQGLAVVTKTAVNQLSLKSRAQVIREGDQPVLRISYEAQSDVPASLIVALRPYNPEGVSFIENLEQLPHAPGWKVNQSDKVILSAPPKEYRLSRYHEGDIYHRLNSVVVRQKIKCEVGMATAGAIYPIKVNQGQKIDVKIPLREEKRIPPAVLEKNISWPEITAQCPRLQIPDERFEKIFNASISTMILHSYNDVYAGPYTYKRFWFRDAVLILNALLCSGLISRVERHLEKFPQRQRANGYFLSQEGEWDSNGEVLWLLKRYCDLTGKELTPRLYQSAVKAAKWIIRKRLPDSPCRAHAGLMPAGFSAEHLGPNDYYYWDNFWSLSGLKSATQLALKHHDNTHTILFEKHAKELEESINVSLDKVQELRNVPVIPASPYRRMDSGAVGSLVCGYPLELVKSDDERLLSTVQYLFDHCRVDGAFFHDFSHSGINPYLTLHMAQVFLRAGDPRYFGLMTAIADIASSTGNWPEAVHPLTKGGCMGDSQHVWAAAEWVMMIRNCFVREEGVDSLILCSGIPAAWYRSQSVMKFGPTLTPFGRVSLEIYPAHQGVEISWNAHWHDQAPKISIQFPELPPLDATVGQTKVFIPLPE